MRSGNIKTNEDLWVTAPATTCTTVSSIHYKKPNTEQSAQTDSLQNNITINVKVNYEENRTVRNQGIKERSRGFTDTKGLSEFSSLTHCVLTTKRLALPLSAQIHHCSALVPSFGHMGEYLNADLKEQECAVRDIELHIVQGRPIEVLLQTPCYHIMWECLHMDSSACRAIYLFATFL